jgi:hypothetical protein
MNSTTCEQLGEDAGKVALMPPRIKLPAPGADIYRAVAE